MSYFDYHNVPNEPFILYDQIDIHFSPSVNDLLVYIHPNSQHQFFEYDMIYFTADEHGAYPFPGSNVILTNNYKSLGQSGMLEGGTKSQFVALVPRIYDNYFIQRIKKRADRLMKYDDWLNVQTPFSAYQNKFGAEIHYDDKLIWTEPIAHGMQVTIPTVCISWGTWQQKEWVLPVHIKYDIGVLMNDYHRPNKVYYSEPNDLYQPDWSFLQPCLKEPGKRPFLPEKYPYDLDHDNPSLPTAHFSRKQRKAYGKWKATIGTQHSSSSNILQDFLKTWNSRRSSAQTTYTR